MEIELSLQSRAIFMSNRALATVLCPFCRPHLQKVLNRALATVSCIFFQPLSPIEPRTRRNREPPSATEKYRVSSFAWRMLVFKPAFRHSRSCRLMSYLHDDVVDIWNRARAHFADIIFQKCAKTLSFLTCSRGNRSHYSLVHSLPTSSSKSARIPTVF